MSKGSVYFAEADGFVKIGYSTNVEARLRSLSTGAPFPVRLIGSHPGTQADEAALHRKFRDHRVSGEWFRASDEIRRVAQTGFEPCLRVNTPSVTGSAAHFLSQIEGFLRRTGMSATRFGMLAVRDPQFVHDVRSGRAPSLATVDRVLAFIAMQDALGRTA